MRPASATAAASRAVTMEASVSTYTVEASPKAMRRVSREKGAPASSSPAARAL